MDVDDRFPARGSHSWQTTRPGYHPNSGIGAQRCEECGALVEYGARGLHNDWHSLIAEATATS